MSEENKDLNSDRNYFDELDELEAGANGVLAASPEFMDKLKQRQEKQETEETS